MLFRKFFILLFSIVDMKLSLNNYNSLCFEHSKPGKVDELRNLVAKTVLSDPINYNEATLQKSPQDYAKFIRQSNSWGGTIKSLFPTTYQTLIFKDLLS